MGASKRKRNKSGRKIVLGVKIEFIGFVGLTRLYRIHFIYVCLCVPARRQAGYRVAWTK
jgi:hypothetical protein